MSAEKVYELFERMQPHGYELRPDGHLSFIRTIVWVLLTLMYVLLPVYLLVVLLVASFEWVLFGTLIFANSDAVDPFIWINTILDPLRDMLAQSENTLFRYLIMVPLYSIGFYLYACLAAGFWTCFALILAPFIFILEKLKR